MFTMLHTLDLAVFHFINGWAGHWGLDHVVRFDEQSYLIGAAIPLAAFCWYWFSPPPTQERHRQEVVTALIAMIVALFLARALADLLPFRLRPVFQPGLLLHKPTVAIPVDFERWSSFPSDNAAMFFALAAGGYFLSRWLGVILGLFALVCICLPRIYTGIHYPSDILVGGLIGVGVSLGCHGLMTAREGWLGRRVMRRVTWAEQRWPQAFYTVALLLCFEIGAMFQDARAALAGVVHVLHHQGVGLSKVDLLLAACLGLAAVAVVVLVALLVMRRVRRGAPHAGEMSSI